MKRIDPVSVLITMLITAALTLSVFLPIAATATDEQARIETPRLSYKGCALSLRVATLDQKTLKPVVRIGSKREEEVEVNVAIRVGLFALKPASQYSRVLAMPSERWQQEKTIRCGEDLALDPDVAIAAGESFSFRLAVRDPEITKEKSLNYSISTRFRPVADVSLLKRIDAAISARSIGQAGQI